MTDDQLEVMRVRLRRELDETTTEIASIDEQVRSFGATDQDTSYGVDNHLGDQADVVYEQERLLSIRDRLADRQVLIEQALAKMDRGEYGYCENCGRPIAPDRLEALPFARYCIDCQAEADRRQGGGRR